MNVLVTGAAGFLAKHLQLGLLKRRDIVVGLYRDTQHLSDSKVNKTVRGDVQDLALLRRVLAQHEIDCVVHLASQTQVSVGLANPEGMIRENINGALAVLEACRLQGTKRIIIASTDKVYGESDGEYIEDQPLAERSPYGVSKACVDMIAETYQKTYGMSIAVTRCGNLYGPGHLNWSTLIPGTIRKIIRGEKPRLRFMGMAKRDFLFVDDAVSAYLKLIDSTECGAFNFSGGEPMMIHEIVGRINQLCGKNPGDFDLVDEKFGEIQFQALNCVKARTHLNWAPATTMNQGLKNTVDWYQKYLTGQY